MEDLFQSQKQNPSLEEEIKPSKAVHFWQVGGGLFVLLFLLLGVFVWHTRYTRDNLVYLAPVDTAVYMSVRNSFWPWENVTIQDLPLSHLFIHQGLLNLSSHAAILKVPGEDGFETVEIFFLKHIEEAVPIIESLEFPAAIDKHVLVVAKNQNMINKIKEVRSGTIFSLVDQLEGRKVGTGLLNIYINSGNLKAQLDQSASLSEQLISYLVKDNLYLTLNKEKEAWVFGPADETNLKGANFDTTLKFLPDDFDIFISQVNLTEVFSNFVAADKAFDQTSTEFIANLEAIYGFDFSSTILPLLNKKAEVVIFNTGQDNALGFDYVLILPQTSDQEIIGFEELLRIILSQKLPKEILRPLPDGTFVTELTADTNSWTWRDSEQGQRILSEPKLNFEVSYLSKDSHLFITSSSELLKKVFGALEISLENLANRCPAAFSSSNFLLLNSNIKSSFDQLLPQGLTVFSDSPKNGLIGCIF